MWIAFVAVIIAQLSYFKEFNGFERKIERYTLTINGLQSKLAWWMSLNRTEKNSRG